MKKIIVPVDFSEQSKFAIKVAASLAKKHDAEILTLHMLELNQAMITSSEGFHPEQTVFLIKLAVPRLVAGLKPDPVQAGRSPGFCCIMSEKRPDRFRKFG